MMNDDLERIDIIKWTNNSRQLKLLIKSNIKLNRLIWRKSEFKEYNDYLRRIRNSWKYYKKIKFQYFL